MSLSTSATNHIFHALPFGPVWLKLIFILFTTRSLFTSSETFGSFTWNYMSTTAQQVASTRLSAWPSTSATVATSSSSTVTSSTSNVSAASRSWNSSGTDSSHPSPQLRKRLAFASWLYFFYFGSPTIHWPALDSSHLFVKSLFVVSQLFFRFLPFCISWLTVCLPHGWYYYCSTFIFLDSSLLSQPRTCYWDPLSYRWLRYSTLACL